MDGSRTNALTRTNLARSRRRIVPPDQREMEGRSRSADAEMATEPGLRVVPTGDAVGRAGDNPRLGFKPDATFDPKTAGVLRCRSDPFIARGLLPEWGKKLAKDANHANAADVYPRAFVRMGFSAGHRRINLPRAGGPDCRVRRATAQGGVADRAANRARERPSRPSRSASAPSRSASARKRCES